MMNAQRKFAKLLNDWLLKFLALESEESPDNFLPLSPNRIGVPRIFVICNDWCRALETTTKDGVSKSIQDFSSSLQLLWQKQNDEQSERLQAEYLESRLKSLREQKESDLVAPESTTKKKHLHPVELCGDLEAMRKTFEEKKARQDKAKEEVDAAISDCFKNRLLTVLEALESFCSDPITAYQHIRKLDAVETAD